MKLLLFCLLNLFSVSVLLGAEVDIIWWNVARVGIDTHGAKIPRSKKEKSRNLLLVSQITKLAETHSPEHFIMGEIVETAFPKSFWDKMRRIYHYHKFFSYNSTYPEFGILVFSKTGPHKTIEKNMPWYPAGRESEFKTKWLRPFSDDPHSKTYVQLEYGVHKASYSLIPVHLMQPWMQIEKEFGVLKTLDIMVNEANQPLIYQLASLLKFTKMLTPPGQRFIVIGDFNFPKKILFRKTYAYSLISKNLDMLGKTGGTFKSSFLNLGTPLDLDQVYGRGVRAQSLKVLKSKGSDHHPIYFQFFF